MCLTKEDGSLGNLLTWIVGNRPLTTQEDEIVGQDIDSGATVIYQGVRLDNVQIFLQQSASLTVDVVAVEEG